MSNEITHIDIKDFVEEGYLHEVNRQFLHPLGLALAVDIDDENETHSLSGIWDYRDDPEGMLFGDEVLDPGKAELVLEKQAQASAYRWKKLGYNIQPVTGPGDPAEAPMIRYSGAMRAITESTDHYLFHKIFLAPNPVAAHEKMELIVKKEMGDEWDHIYDKEISVRPVEEEGSGVESVHE